MALPVIWAVAAAATAAYGAVKGKKAMDDNKRAKRYNYEAEEIIEQANQKLERTRKNGERALETLGKKKMQAVTQELAEFVVAFEQLKNVELNSQDAENLKLGEFAYQAIAEIRHDVQLLKDSGVGLAGGATTGALTALGAYSGAMALGTASTGTAISTLGGIAAKNATLAWFGGGSLASGGLGVAGGSAVLGGLAAGPAIAIAGWYMGNKAEKNLNDARSNYAMAEAYQADTETAIKLTEGITKVAKKAESVLTALRIRALKTNLLLTGVLNAQGTDYAQFDEQGKDNVLKALKTAQLLKAMVDTPILDENGALLGDAESRIQALSEQ